MPIKFACRHCGVALAVTDGYSGLIRCPSCSRSTQYPAPAPERELPPPTSGYGAQPASNRAAPFWLLGLAWLAMAVGVAIFAREWFPAVSVGEALALYVAVTVGLGVYFIPAIVATHRSHPNQAPILVVNLLLGWTLVGWTVALAWSLVALEKTPRR